MQRQQKRNIIHDTSTAYTTLRQPATDLRMWRRSSQKWRPDVASFSWGDRSIFASYAFQNFTSAGEFVCCCPRRRAATLRPAFESVVRLAKSARRMLAAMTFVGNVAAAHAGQGLAAIDSRAGHYWPI
jgi:hypothetical protein